MGKNIIFQIGNNSQELTLGLHIQWNQKIPLKYVRDNIIFHVKVQNNYVFLTFQKKLYKIGLEKHKAEHLDHELYKMLQF